MTPDLSIHLAVEPVPIQSNPAYEALETIIPSAQAAGRVHQLQPSTRTDLCKKTIASYSCIPIKQKHKVRTPTL